MPKTVTRQRRGCDLNPGPTAPESSTLTTRLPRHNRQSVRLTGQDFCAGLGVKRARPYDLDLELTLAVGDAQLDFTHAQRTEHLPADDLARAETVDKRAELAVGTVADRRTQPAAHAHARARINVTAIVATYYYASWQRKLNAETAAVLHRITSLPLQCFNVDGWPAGRESGL